MALFLSTVLIGISFCLSIPESIDKVMSYTNNDELAFVPVDFADANYGYRRFVSEHQMWCAPGAEVSVGVKTNLLYWLVATPNGGVELFWRRKWSFSVEGVYASWLFDQGEKFYYLTAVVSELRYWLRKDGRFNGHYVGVGLYWGQYDMQFRPIGEQGDFTGFGFSYGYDLPINKHLNLEFGIGVGCINRDYVKYEVLGNEFARTEAGQKLWYGPTKVSVACVWQIGNKRRGRR